MSFAIRVNRVKVMHGNKKLYIRQSMLLHVCVVMWNDLVEMEKFDEAIKKGEFLEQCCWVDRGWWDLEHKWRCHSKIEGEKVGYFGMDAGMCIGVVRGACGNFLLIASSVLVKWEPSHNLGLEMLKIWGQWKNCEILKKKVNE